MNKKNDRRLTGDGPTAELGKIARFINWFTPAGFIANMTNRAISRELEKKAKKESKIQELMEMNAEHVKNIRSLQKKIVENRKREKPDD